jgi:hypothetical protein
MYYIRRKKGQSLNNLYKHTYIRYVLVFFIIVFLQEIFVYFLPPVYVYIRSLALR